MSVPNGLILNPSPEFYNESVNPLIDHIDKLDFKLGRVQNYYGL
jgi:hypothetical protein